MPCKCSFIMRIITPLYHWAYGAWEGRKGERKRHNTRTSLGRESGQEERERKGEQEEKRSRPPGKSPQSPGPVEEREEREEDRGTRGRLFLILITTLQGFLHQRSQTSHTSIGFLGQEGMLE